MSIKFDFLPAGSGDSILIQTEDFAALIDSGDAHCHQEIKNYLVMNLGVKKLNLIILTHIDDDHIGGMRKLLNDQSFYDLLDAECQVWMNYPNGQCSLFPMENNNNQISYQGGDLIKQNLKGNIKHIDNIHVESSLKEINLSKNLSLTLLSPDKEHLDKLCKQWRKKSPNFISSTGNIKSDYCFTFEELELEKDKNNNWIPNGSSIAFILTYKDNKKTYNFLFLADAYPKIITDSLVLLGFSERNPLELEFIKVSHHGSKYNNTRDFFKYVSSSNFIFLTNDPYSLPHKRTLSRINSRKNKTSISNFIFNYAEAMQKVKNDLCIKNNSISCMFLRTITYGGNA